MRVSGVALHRGGRSRHFIHKDPTLKTANTMMGRRNVARMGIGSASRLWTQTGVNGQKQYDHAFPLLSHDDLGNSDQSNNTRNIQLSMYMPKRNKGTAPWFRGADTYSVQYSEQGRYEYQRYLMIARFPSDYKRHFMRFLNNIRAPQRAAAHTLPQEALHWVQRMIVDNFNPQHVHYVAAMQTLLHHNEFDMARDVWKTMERQQTLPDDKCIVTFLEVCAAAQEKSWAFEAWNRYCGEKKFLCEGEADPKPVTRVPFSLTREELLYLPKWKKHFDHDPNLDVADLNRFNTTRQIYLRMATAMLACGEALWATFFDRLEEALLTTPTPVPEPPNPHLVPIPRWAPHEAEETIDIDAWRAADTARVRALGPALTEVDEMHCRFFSNDQFLVYSVKELLRAVENSPIHNRMDVAVSLMDRLFDKLRGSMGTVQTDSLLWTWLRLHRTARGLGGHDLHQIAQEMLSRKARAAGEDVVEAIPAAGYLEILRGYAHECHPKHAAASLSHKIVMAHVCAVLREMGTSVEWSADMHLSVVQILSYCGTDAANAYFVANVLRAFPWTSDFLEALYIEYRRCPEVETWAELTKRALVWTARYRVEVSESLRRLIEEDYDVIRVQVRSFRELAVFQFRDVEEKRHARDPVNQLPNPLIDYVGHALPFPDRDTGYPDEYGDIGQWRAPGPANSPTKGPGYYAPPMYGEHLRGYTAEWRDPKNPRNPPKLPTPWNRKYQQYAPGQHPSYDMVYAGPFPEVWPQRHNFRKPTRWDYHDIQKQSKFRISGPY